MKFGQGVFTLPTQTKLECVPAGLFTHSKAAVRAWSSALKRGVYTNILICWTQLPFINWHTGLMTQSSGSTWYLPFLTNQTHNIQSKHFISYNAINSIVKLRLHSPCTRRFAWCKCCRGRTWRLRLFEYMTSGSLVTYWTHVGRVLQADSIHRTTASPCICPCTPLFF